MKRHLSLIYSIYLRRIKRWWGIYDTERLESELFGTDVRTMWTRMSETTIDGMNEINPEHLKPYQQEFSAASRECSTATKGLEGMERARAKSACMSGKLGRGK